ncbi:hypothetical protein [Curtobacterium sp. MCBD17_028]|uniref:hypothetical protein n=1 Tax=Curtobacterium sp. MCBD17_028 TaxID=2175670 RepID=UPI0011B62832|nr:hypothetical protein [Curtobacterium sp. MCBD17_028]
MSYGPLQSAPPSRPAGQINRALTSELAADRVRAALVGVGGFVIAYAIGIITMLLAALLAPHTETTTGSGTANLSDTLTSISDLAATPVQLILVADLGRLGISGQDALIVQFAGSFAIGFVSLFIAAAQIIAIVVLSRRTTRPRSLTQHVAMSLLSGVLLAVLTLLAGLVLRSGSPAGAARRSAPSAGSVRAQSSWRSSSGRSRASSRGRSSWRRCAAPSLRGSASCASSNAVRRAYRAGDGRPRRLASRWRRATACSRSIRSSADSRSVRRHPEPPRPPLRARR